MSTERSIVAFIQNARFPNHLLLIIDEGSVLIRQEISGEFVYTVVDITGLPLCKLHPGDKIYSTETLKNARYITIRSSGRCVPLLSLSDFLHTKTPFFFKDGNITILAKSGKYACFHGEEFALLYDYPYWFLALHANTTSRMIVVILPEDLYARQHGICLKIWRFLRMPPIKDFVTLRKKDMRDLSLGVYWAENTPPDFTDKCTSMYTPTSLAINILVKTIIFFARMTPKQKPYQRRLKCNTEKRMQKQ